MGMEKIILQTNRVENADYLEYIKESFRSQRHDYMNYFQIVYAYIQLGKTNEAINSIKDVINLNLNLSNIYNLSLFHLSLYLDKVIRELNDLEYKTKIIVKNHTSHDLRIIKNEGIIISCLDNIFNNYINNDCIENSMFYLEVEELEGSISFLFVGNYNISTIIENCDNLEESTNENGTSITFYLKE